MGYKWSATRNYCVTILSHTIENTANYRNASGKLTFENTMVFLLSLPRENKVRKGIPVTHQLSNLMLFLEPRRYKLKFKIFYVDKLYILFSPCQLWPNSLFLISFGANTKARLSTHATPTSRPAILDFCVACVLNLAFVSRQIILRIPNNKYHHTGYNQYLMSRWMLAISIIYYLFCNAAVFLKQ